jgi:uncharacterized membrane protein YtjA (UPF0391 family)
VIAHDRGPRYLAGMDPALSPDQYRALREAVRTRMNYLHGVRVRMSRLGAVDGDPLKDRFGRAERAMTRLGNAPHDKTIVPGDRRPGRPCTEPAGEGRPLGRGRPFHPSSATPVSVRLRKYHLRVVPRPLRLRDGVGPWRLAGRRSGRPAVGFHVHGAAHAGLTSLVPESLPSAEAAMLRWALAFFAVAVVAAVFGFTWIVGEAVRVGEFFVVAFLVLAVASFVNGRRRRRSSRPRSLGGRGRS